MRRREAWGRSARDVNGLSAPTPNLYVYANGTNPYIIVSGPTNSQAILQIGDIHYLYSTTQTFLGFSSGSKKNNALGSDGQRSTKNLLRFFLHFVLLCATIRGE